MKIEEETIEVDGIPGQISRIRFEPDSVAKPAGGVVMVHGLGDHLARYRHVAEFFCERGLRCTGVDLPGHGKSDGQRGHIRHLETITDLVDLALFQFAEELPDSAPIGIFAHSMGGFVVLEHIVRRQQLLKFVWLSSPLIRPSDGQNRFLVWLSKRFGWLAPRLPFDNGVERGDCHPITDPETGEILPRDPLKHRQITFAFAAELMRQEKIAAEAVRELTGDLSLLITHGNADRVCPHEFSKELFDSIPLRAKKFVTVEGALHEPLHSPEADWTFAQAADWFDSLNLVKPEPAGAVES